jgi:hypothetical protein
VDIFERSGPVRGEGEPARPFTISSCLTYTTRRYDAVRLNDPTEDADPLTATDAVKPRNVVFR